MGSAYAPPFDGAVLPRTREEWRRRAGLTDPAVLATAVRHRICAGETDNPSYADFFRMDESA